MGNKQFLSVLGLYNYDESLFENLALPSGVDKSLVINNILLDNAELSLIYTDYDFMKFAIGSWSLSELDVWTRLNNAFNEQYNPIWNVDGTTTETREIQRSGNDYKDSSSTNTINSSSSSDSNTTNSIKGYNSDSWAEHDKSVVDAEDTGTSNEIGHVNEDGSHNENIKETYTQVRGGNIGVTMSQQLLEAELNVRPKLNIYKYISNSFKKRFCNMIY